MRNITSVKLLFALSAIGLFVATGCKQPHQNPVDYHNKLMSVMNQNSRDMQAMNAAMTSGDYKKAAEVRQKWVGHLDTALKEVNGLGGFEGDESFQRAVLNGLKSYKKAVSRDYKKLIEIRRKGDSGQPVQEGELLNTINETFTRAGEAINREAAAFQSQYGK